MYQDLQVVGGRIEVVSVCKFGVTWALLKIFLNKATSDCFVNLRPIFTAFSVLVNNDNYSSHVTSFWLPWKPFWPEFMNLTYVESSFEQVRLYGIELCCGLEITHFDMTSCTACLQIPPQLHKEAAGMYRWQWQLCYNTFPSQGSWLTSHEPWKIESIKYPYMR